MNRKIRSTVAAMALAGSAMLAGVATAPAAHADSCMSIGQSGNLYYQGSYVGYVHMVYCPYPRTVQGEFIAPGWILSNRPWKITVGITNQPRNVGSESGFSNSWVIESPAVRIDDVPDQNYKAFNAYMRVTVGGCSGTFAITNTHNFANGAEWNSTKPAEC
ncbi:hypothetical protein ACFZDG_33670 [Kitasatospora xanthocidica]|uniref:hypothetical protein n=1 Tax=Kitasatospora xanthocidica TaxID=83382 RepID=UPI0036E0FC5A